jgi:hypothetical protein
MGQLIRVSDYEDYKIFKKAVKKINRDLKNIYSNKNIIVEKRSIIL